MVSNGGDPSKGLESVVQLGFSVELEDDDHRMAVGHRSPHWRDWDGGQIGGRPTWLNPKDIPKTFMTCKSCEEHLTFVCQLYAPCEDSIPNAFHRTFYVFACQNTKVCGTECTGTVRVVRAQLSQENPYLPEDHNDTWAMHLPESWGVNVCKVCGQRANGKCPIQGHFFCGRHHQKEHKKYIFDKESNPSSQLPSVLTESELVVEEEPLHIDDHSAHEKADRALFKAQGIDSGEDFLDSDDDDEDKDLEQKDLNEMTGAAEETVTGDRISMKFYDRINNLPNVNTQCLRYLRWPDEDSSTKCGAPLWIRSDCQPPGTIPSCERCGADRKFEFQLMPQMVHYLLKGHNVQRETDQVKGGIKKEEVEAIKTATNLIDQSPPDQVPPEFAATKEKAVEAMRAKLMEDDTNKLDWGVVAVYTCTASCGGMDTSEGSDLGAYIEEYTWKQPSLD
jgi:pre-rRNA-processing protein TSR4